MLRPRSLRCKASQIDAPAALGDPPRGLAHPPCPWTGPSNEASPKGAFVDEAAFDGLLEDLAPAWKSSDSDPRTRTISAMQRNARWKRLAELWRTPSEATPLEPRLQRSGGIGCKSGAGIVRNFAPTRTTTQISRRRCASNALSLWRLGRPWPTARSWLNGLRTARSVEARLLFEI